MDVMQEMIRYDRLRHIKVYIHKVHFVNEHMHGSFELSYVLEGSAQVHQGMESRTVEPGDLILTNPYEHHSCVSLTAEPIIMLTVQIHKLFVRRYIDCVPKLIFNPRQIADLPPHDHDALVNLLFQTAIAYFDNELCQQFVVLAYAALLLSKLVSTLEWHLEDNSDNSEKELQKNRMQRLISYIDENYRQKITLSTLAAMEGITTTYLSHFFKKAFGVSFQTYLSTQRLEKALILMRDKSISMVDICMNCGFSDSRYLEAACKSFLGCTVSEYRRRLDMQEEIGIKKTDDELNEKLSRKASLLYLRKHMDNNSRIHVHSDKPKMNSEKHAE